MPLNLNQQQNYADDVQHVARMRSVIVQLAVAKAAGAPPVAEQRLIGLILRDPATWARRWWLAVLTDDTINEAGGNLSGVGEVALTTIATAQWAAFVHAAAVEQV